MALATHASTKTPRVSVENQTPKVSTGEEKLREVVHDLLVPRTPLALENHDRSPEGRVLVKVTVPLVEVARRHQKAGIVQELKISRFRSRKPDVIPELFRKLPKLREHTR